jgi:hypothetical protein
MHRLRTTPFLARLVLAWFLGVVGLAGAAPLIHPQSLELVCGASGAVKLVVVSAAGDDETSPRTQALGPHGLECALCLQLQAPPPSLPPVGLSRAVPHPVPVSWHEWGFTASWHGAPLPARGPPGFAKV